jgi:hypothetical protein
MGIGFSTFMLDDISQILVLWQEAKFLNMKLTSKVSSNSLIPSAIFWDVPPCSLVVNILEEPIAYIFYSDDGGNM